LSKPVTPPKQIEDSQEPNSFWQATFEGGHGMVALEHICSVNRHQYVLGGAVIAGNAVTQLLVRLT
jgi:hypothetical protein